MIRRFLKFFRKSFVSFRNPAPENSHVTDWLDHPRMIAKASRGQRRSREVAALYERNHTILDLPDRAMPYLPVGAGRGGKP
jgi:hypothetical protein